MIVTTTISKLYLPPDKDLYRTVDRKSALMAVMLLKNDTPLTLRRLTDAEKQLSPYKNKEFFVCGGMHRIYRMELDLVLAPPGLPPLDDDSLSKEEKDARRKAFEEEQVQALLKDGLGSDIIL
jgi:hypothetical protein